MTLPIPLDKSPRVCSVCGKSSYSSGGIHPQCAEAQADGARVARLKAARKAEMIERALIPRAPAKVGAFRSDRRT